VVFEGGAHGTQYRRLLGLGVQGVHEVDGHAVQAVEAHFPVVRVGGRAAQQGAAQLVGVQRRGFGGGDPGVLDAGQIDQQLAPVEGGERPHGQHLAGPVELVAQREGRALRRGEQVGQRQIGPVAEFGQRPGDQFERGDARVVDVVVGPGLAGEAAQVFQAFAIEGLGVASGGLGGAREGGGDERVGGHQVSSAMRCCGAETRIASGASGASSGRSSAGVAARLRRKSVT
jgi:hypothetical protein